MFLGLPGICLCVSQTLTIFDKFKILASYPNLRIRDDSEIAKFWHCKSKFQPLFILNMPRNQACQECIFLCFTNFDIFGVKLQRFYVALEMANLECFVHFFRDPWLVEWIQKTFYLFMGKRGTNPVRKPTKQYFSYGFLSLVVKN